MIVTAEPADKTTTPESKQKFTKISVYLGLVLLLIVLLLAVFYILNIQEINSLKQENQDLNNKVESLEAAASDEEDMLKYCKEYILNGEDGNDDDSGMQFDKCEQYFEQVERCSSRSCLFNGPEAVEGLGWIKGYYTTIDRVDWGDTNVQCEVLVVTGGSKLLIDDFKDKIDRGNRINTLNHNGELLVNVNLKDNEFSDQVRNSTNENQIEIKVVRSSPLGRSVSVCYSFFDIIDVDVPADTVFEY